MLRRTSPSLLLAVFSLFLACGGGEDQQPTEPSEPQSQVTTVTVSPGSTELNAFGATEDFEATAKDQNGNTMSGVSFTWSSSDRSVATVDGSGTATAEGNGSITITAEASGVEGSADLTVDQDVAELSVSPSSTELQQVGDTSTLSAEATDPNGHDVTNLDANWSISDTTLATVDGEGLVTGLRSGEATAVASAGSKQASASVSITTGLPTIQSVEPTTLAEDSTAVLTGDRFSPTMSTVTVDGTEAQVQEATLSRAVIRVPTFNCLPARDVAVSLSVPRQQPSQTGKQLDPDEAPLQLAVGEQRIVQNPADFCLQFKETSSAEAYLTGLQSTSVTPGLTETVVTSVASEGGSSDIGLDPVQDRSGDVALQPPTEAEVQATERHHQILQAGRRLLSRSTWKPAATRSSVDSTVSEGDTVDVRVPRDDRGDLCTSFDNVTAVIRHVSDHGILAEDLSNPQRFTEDALQDMGDWFDAVRPLEVSYYGEPADTDNNEGTVVLFTKSVNQGNANQEGSTIGFVLSTDLVRRTECPASDGGELIYFLSPDVNGQYNVERSGSEVINKFTNSAPHEYTHVIQLSGRFKRNQPLMTLPIMEAQAQLSEEIIGHAANERKLGANYGFEVAWNENDDFPWYKDGFEDLIDYFGFDSNSTGQVPGAPEECTWLSDDPSPCQGRALWYGVGWSFLRWISDHFGPNFADGEAELHRSLVDNEKTGFNLLADVTGASTDALLAQWAAAFYTDDRILSAPNRLTFPSWDMLDVEQSLKKSAWLNPEEALFADFSTTVGVNAASNYYLRISGTRRPATAVRFRSPGGETLGDHMQVWIVRTQ